MKATMLACSFAGITYIPIDESMPEERLRQIINQIDPGLIIGRNIDKQEIYKIMVQDNFKEIEKVNLKPEDIYYIIFTSGSTGVPKGVKVTYKNLDSCINWLKEIIGTKKGVIINQANFSFDLSVADFYLSLVCESEHFIINDISGLDFKEIFKQLNNSKADSMVLTPSFADLLLLDQAFCQSLMPNLHTILFCGERLTKSTIYKLYERFPNLRIINSYGPTECTFAVTSIKIEKNLLEDDIIPVGVAKKDVDIYVVDDKLKKLPEGKIGEIMITGESVADGYVRENLEKSFFMYNGKKAFLTGDLGFMRKNVLYYEARKDNQIKYKGYRIELEDIEKNLLDLAYVEGAVVVVKKNSDGKIIRLVAFVTLKAQERKTEMDIKEDLLEKIPEYMCPKIKVISNFPLNQNGKCDKKRLMEEYL